MKFDDWLLVPPPMLALACCLFVSGCGQTPDAEPPVAVPAAASSPDPIDVAIADGFYDPPPLLEAIADRELDRVRQLLAAGENINQHDPVYGTPLIAALQAGEDEIVAALLEAGAHRDGTSAYFLAAGELPAKTLEPAVRAVADKFAERNQLTLRAHEELPGLLLCDIDDLRGRPLIEQHQAELVDQGWFLFRFAHDARRRQDIVGLLPTSDKYVVLAFLQTDGLNYNITTERIIDWLQRLEKENPFVITEAGLDYVGGKFLQRVRLPGRLAERLLAFCPDIVDQGAGSVANLERELSKPEPPLYLWWD